MRLAMVALAVAGGLTGLGAPSVAGAQGMMGGGVMGQGTMAQPNTRLNDPFAHVEYQTAQQRYAEQLAALRKKLLRLKLADGGELSPAHQAALQQELDAINKTYAANSPPPRGGARR
jgi:hypothetical protein